VHFLYLTELFHTEVVEKIKTRFRSITLFTENNAICEIMWKNMIGVETGHR